MSRTWRKIWLSDRINRQLLTITTHYSGNKWWELRNLSVRGCNYPDILLKFSPTIHKELNLRSLRHGAIVVEEHFQWYVLSLLEFPGATNHACLPLQFNSAMLNLIRCIQTKLTTWQERESTSPSQTFQITKAIFRTMSTQDNLFVV